MFHVIIHTNQFYHSLNSVFVIIVINFKIERWSSFYIVCQELESEILFKLNRANWGAFLKLFDCGRSLDVIWVAMHCSKVEWACHPPQVWALSGQPRCLKILSLFNECTSISYLAWPVTVEIMPIFYNLLHWWRSD